MNDAIRAAATRHPEMTIVDWNLYSRSHPEWFQTDGLHLNGAGATAMATLLHQALSDLGIPAVLAPPPAPAQHTLTIGPARLADGRVAMHYRAMTQRTRRHQAISLVADRRRPTQRAPTDQ